MASKQTPSSIPKRSQAQSSSSSSLSSQSQTCATALSLSDIITIKLMALPWHTFFLRQNVCFTHMEPLNEPPEITAANAQIASRWHQTADVHCGHEKGGNCKSPTDFQRKPGQLEEPGHL